MLDITKLDFTKLGGLIPAIITDKKNTILMLGFMNKEALEKTLETGLVTFFSRTKKRLWTKGETSGNYLKVTDISSDCDNDTILIHAMPKGNTCHTGSYSCFGNEIAASKNFLDDLFTLIKERKEKLPAGSYTSKLFLSGDNRIIQKVGEEAIETVIAAKNRDKKEIVNEVSDLMYHLFVMLVSQGIEFSEIIENLELRHQPGPA